MRKILYGKIGRSMPLTLDKCGVVGGDQEMTAVVTTLAQRHPDDAFILIGRNSGEDPRTVGLPPNVFNPWHTLGRRVREQWDQLGLRGNLSVEQHRLYAEILDDYMTPHFADADAVIMWAGQHGTSNGPIPTVRDRLQLTKPHDAFAHYAGFLLRGINRWRDVDPLQREEIWLNADPRNYLKMRDLKWPLRHPVLTQFNYTHNIKHERYGDPASQRVFDEWYGRGVRLVDDIRSHTWSSKVANVYSRLELNLTVPGTPSGDHLRFHSDWRGRGHFGIVINEARANGVRESLTRLTAMRDWVLPLAPEFIHGTWSQSAQDSLNRQIDPIEWRKYVRLLSSVRTTFTTPSSGSGWATTKPWEAFATGTVCFFHPAYDTQNNILADAPESLVYLRVKTPRELRLKVDFLSSLEGRHMWETLVHDQRHHYDNSVRNPLYVRMIENRIYGETQ
jgi:hypothetical protein